MERRGVFISHAHEDKELAECVRQLLEVGLELDAADITCTSDADYGLERGGELKDQIRGRLDSARALFLLATPASRQKDWVQFESAYAEKAVEAGDMQFYVMLPTPLHGESVPAPYRTEVAVTLNRGAEVHAFVGQLRKSFGIPAALFSDAYIDAILTLEDHSCAIDAKAREAATDHRIAFAMGQRKMAIAIGVLCTLIGTGAGVTTARAGRDGALTRLGQEHKKQISDLTEKGDARLHEVQKEMSEQNLKAEQARDAELKSLPFSGLLQDGLARPLRCSQVEAQVPGAGGGERKIPKSCDSLGTFTIPGPMLQADPRQRITLKVTVGNKSYEIPVTRSDARLAIAIPGAQ